MQSLHGRSKRNLCSPGENPLSVICIFRYMPELAVWFSPDWQVLSGLVHVGDPVNEHPLVFLEAGTLSVKRIRVRYPGQAVVFGTR